MFRSLIGTPAKSKRDSNTGVSCECCDIFQRNYFEEYLRMALSVIDYDENKCYVYLLYGAVCLERHSRPVAL